MVSPPPGQCSIHYNIVASLRLNLGLPIGGWGTQVANLAKPHHTSKFSISWGETEKLRGQPISTSLCEPL